MSDDAPEPVETYETTLHEQVVKVRRFPLGVSGRKKPSRRFGHTPDVPDYPWKKYPRSSPTALGWFLLMRQAWHLYQGTDPRRRRSRFE